jgi:hypothetical protein
VLSLVAVLLSGGRRGLAWRQLACCVRGGFPQVEAAAGWVVGLATAVVHGDGGGLRPSLRFPNSAVLGMGW